MAKKAHFDNRLFGFIEELAAYNDRDWFQANKERYEDEVREPSLQFISDFGPKLRTISPHFNAIPKKVGGSMFRINRDVRFSRDKSPYKTHVGIHFRHKQHKDAHAPGFYLHLEPSGCFIGLGIWHPDSAALKSIREHLDQDQSGWKRAMGRKVFKSGRLSLSGEALSRPPRGFDKDHPLIEDLKRKDFIAIGDLKKTDVTKPGFIDDFAAQCKAGAPLVEWLCKALDVEF